MKSKVDWRRITSLFLTLAFLIISISGIILFISPPGRIAHWTYWAILGLTKTEWQAIHIIFTFSFIFFMVLHIIYNWKFLISYMKLKIKNQFKLNKELILATFLTLFLFIFTLAEIPPFSSVVELGESISDSWSNDQTEPPIPHAEEMNLFEISELLGIDLNKIIIKMKNAGYKFDTEEQTLTEIGELNGVTPDIIYKSIAGKDTTAEKVHSAGSGYGRMSLIDLCGKLDISLESALQKLHESDIDAEPDQKIKEIAADHQLLPVDIVNILEKE